MSRHHAPHDFKVDDEVVILAGFGYRRKYPGKVLRVTPTRVHVAYDASSTGGQKQIHRTFYGATGRLVGGGFMGSPMLGRKA